MEENIAAGMIIKVRAAYPSISISGTDYFDKLAPYFLSLTYVDDCSGEKADDLQLHLADRDRRFISDWMPDKGTSIKVAIIAERWFAPNAAALSLDCGEFWIDSVDFELPQHTVAVKAMSIPTDARIKASEVTARAWENTSLRKIAEQIAKENNMEVTWEADVDPKYRFVEQTTQSDLAFLQQRAIDAKLAIKVANRKLIFFDEEKYEAKSPSFTIVYGNAAGASGLSVYRMSGGVFVTRLTDATKVASVAHMNPESMKLMNEQFSVSDEDLSEFDQDQKINEDPGYEPDSGEEPDLLLLPRRAGELPSWSMNTSAAGQRKAKSVARHKNRDKFRASIEMSIGNPLIAAGQTCTLAGVGQFDGKWFVESVTHNLGPMYTTRLEVRRCLQGY